MRPVTPCDLLIQTTASQAVWWRAEYEPYGRVFAYNPTSLADQHQPLRLPGQEAELFNLDQNGTTERSYNVFRWYRSSWGRYTQSDPIRWAYFLPEPRFMLDPSPYSYAIENPTGYSDPSGLVACLLGECGSSSTGTGQSCCEEIRRRKEFINRLLDAYEGKKPRPTKEFDIGFEYCGDHTYVIDVEDLRRHFSPCLFPCALQHEQRHAEQCRRFGAAYTGRYNDAMQRAAFMQELGCLIKQGRGQ